MDYKTLWIELLEHFETKKRTHWNKDTIIELMKKSELEMARRIGDESDRGGEK